MTELKQLWVLAGANGAGKSTFYKTSLLSERGVKFVNADLIAKNINPGHPEKVSYEASHIVERIRDEFIFKGISFCFETVFSHASKIDFIAKAKAHGYYVILIYIHLDILDLNEARVSQRVREGGHNVPPEKIRSRLPRTMKNVAVALQLVDEAWLLDNSFRDKPYQQIALVKRGRCMPVVEPLPAWVLELTSRMPHLKSVST